MYVVAFQLKTQKIGQLILLIIGFVLIAVVIQHLSTTTSFK